MSNRTGFSMVELLIAVALALLLSTGIISAALHGTNLSRQLRLGNEVLEAGRYLVSTIDGQISLAGFYGPLDLTMQEQLPRPDICTANGAVMQYPVDGLNNVAQNYRLCGGEALLANTDSLLIRRAEISAMLPGSPLISEQHYIQVQGNQYIRAIGADAGAFSLRQRDGTTASPIRVWTQSLYYVSGDHVLKRRRYIKGRYSNPEPLAEGVDDLQIFYGIDRSGDGVANGHGGRAAFVSAPQNANEWQNIVAIKYYLLLSSNENGLAMADRASYNYADKTDVTFNDHKQRKLFYGFSRLRNSVSVRGDE